MVVLERCDDSLASRTSHSSLSRDLFLCVLFLEIDEIMRDNRKLPIAVEPCRRRFVSDESPLEDSTRCSTSEWTGVLKRPDKCQVPKNRALIVIRIRE